MGTPPLVSHLLLSRGLSLRSDAQPSLVSESSTEAYTEAAKKLWHVARLLTALTTIRKQVLAMAIRAPGLTPSFPCSLHVRASSVRAPPIKVIVNGATTDLGKAAIAAVTKARGMELAGAIDDNCVGQDAGEIASLGTPLELPITNNLIMVLGSLSQSTTAGVMVDFSEPSRIYENVRQATAFGLRSVVSTPGLDMGVVSKLITFCEKASMGCIIAPTLSIGLILLQEAAAAAAFHYNYVEIIESQQGLLEYPSSDAQRVAKSLCGLGRIYNEADYSKDYPARGEVVEDGVRIHSMKLPGLLRSMGVHLSAPGEVLSFKHDVTDVRANMPGMLLAIRRVIRLKNLVYGLEKIL